MQHSCSPAAFSTPCSYKCLLLISTKYTYKFCLVFLSGLKQNGVSSGNVSQSAVSFSAAVMLILGLSPLMLKLGGLSALLFPNRH